MKFLLTSFALTMLPLAGMAETSLIDLTKLPSKTAYDVATVTPLAVSESGPAVLLLDLDAGTEVPPHATKGALRLMTVVSGDLYWGDGDTPDKAAESRFPAGSVLTVPAGEMHWLAARDGAVRIQMIILDTVSVVPGIKEQMK